MTTNKNEEKNYKIEIKFKKRELTERQNENKRCIMHILFGCCAEIHKN